MKIKKSITLLTAVFVLLLSCSDEFMSKEENSTINDDKAVTIKISMDNDSSRTALPEVDVEKLSYLILRYSDSKNSESSSIIGEWNSVAEMTEKSLNFRLGTYTFSFYASNGASIFTDSKEYEIKEGENTLSFSPKLTVTGTESYGKGNLEIEMNCNPMKGTEQVIKLVTCALYTLDGEIVPGCSETALEMTSAGKCKYSKSDIQSGIYVALFSFFGDTEKRLPVANYREYATIADGFTSKSKCTLNSTSEIFSINYELNGGHFSEGFTTAGSYTRKGGECILPAAENVSKEVGDSEYRFYGWYDNPECEGLAVKSIPSGSTGNKTFYAKWRKVLTITFVKNDGGATTKTQSAVEGEAVALKSLEELEFADSRKFLGWAKRSATTSEKLEHYGDGDPVTIYEDLILYAEWGAISITGDSSKDTDGDGLSDHDEIEIWHTDPASKDTDGDGWTDEEEGSLYNADTRTFNPLIADLPKLDIEIAGDPKIYYNFSSAVKDDSSESENISRSSSGSQSSSKANAHSHSQTYTWSEKTGIKVANEYAVATGPHWSLTLSGDQTTGYNVTNGDTCTYTSSQSEGWSNSWTNGRAKSRTTSKTVMGGTLEIPIKFKNIGNIAYVIKNATISIYRIPTDKPLALELTSTVAKDYSITLAPLEESGQYKLEVNFSDPEKIEQLLKYSSGFTVSLASYNITMYKDKSATGRVNDFTEANTEVNAKTASIFIDWGLESGRKAKTYNVSVKNRYRSDATGLDDLYEETSLKYALDDILKVPESEGNGYKVGSRGLIESFYGIKNKSDPKNGVWIISHSKLINAAERYIDFYSTPYSVQDMSKIILHPGDKISILYTVDKDGDGVPLHEEIFRKTSDEKADTDGDGISDFDEIHGWLASGLHSKYSETNKVYTNPALADTDGDGDKDGYDFDPMVAKVSNDATLKSLSYSITKPEDAFTALSFNNAEIPEASVPGKLETSYVYLYAQPSLPFARVLFSRDGSTFNELTKNTKLSLEIGQNKVYLKCIAPDETTEKQYIVNIDSDFTAIEDFSVGMDSRPGIFDGNVKLSWKSYKDERCEVTNTCKGGYVLYIKKEASVNAFDLPITKAKEDVPVGKIKDLLTAEKLKLHNEFAFRLSKGDLTSGGVDFNLLPNKSYSVYLFAFTGSDMVTTYKYKCLASKSFKTPKSGKGKLTFYAHYIEDMIDGDGTYDPQFSWDINDLSTFGLGPYSVAEKDAKDWDVDNETEAKYWAFGTKRYYSYMSPPGKFTETTKEFTREFSRGSDASFTITWQVNVKYISTYSLGTVTATFNYSCKEDKWTCSWELTNLGSRAASSNPEIITLGYGERTSGKKWVVKRILSSQVDFHWDLGWDYEGE